MKMLNQVKITFAGRSVNEGFARAALAAFLVQLDPTVPQLADIKTAVSEAVTNCIVHAYPDLSLIHILPSAFPLWRMRTRCLCWITAGSAVLTHPPTC